MVSMVGSEIEYYMYQLLQGHKLTTVFKNPALPFAVQISDLIPIDTAYCV